MIEFEFTDYDLNGLVPYSMISVSHNYKLLEKKGWHIASKDYVFTSLIGYEYNVPRCNCLPTTKSGKGAYRDEIYENRHIPITIYYYHHHPIVYETPDRYVIDNCDFETSSTKERINRYILGAYIWQHNYVWYIDTNPRYGEVGKFEFKNGMTLWKEPNVDPYQPYLNGWY